MCVHPVCVLVLACILHTRAHMGTECKLFSAQGSRTGDGVQCWGQAPLPQPSKPLTLGWLAVALLLVLQTLGSLTLPFPPAAGPSACPLALALLRLGSADHTACPGAVNTWSVGFLLSPWSPGWRGRGEAETMPLLMGPQWPLLCGPGFCNGSWGLPRWHMLQPTEECFLF